MRVWIDGGSGNVSSYTQLVPLYGYWFILLGKCRERAPRAPEARCSGGASQMSARSGTRSGGHESATPEERNGARRRAWLGGEGTALRNVGSCLGTRRRGGRRRSARGIPITDLVAPHCTEVAGAGVTPLSEVRIVPPSRPPLHPSPSRRKLGLVPRNPSRVLGSY